jgi:hypothetical protein
MPTQKQRALFSMLRKDFSFLGCWKPLTNGQDFDAMSDHEAMHYLGFLVAAFPAVRYPASCHHCGKPFHYYEPAKSPVDDQPGSSTDPAS